MQPENPEERRWLENVGAKSTLFALLRKKREQDDGRLRKEKGMDDGRLHEQLLSSPEGKMTCV
jgi:hypothetical protein